MNYVKPVMECVDLRAEERIAVGSVCENIGGVCLNPASGKNETIWISPHG